MAFKYTWISRSKSGDLPLSEAPPEPKILLRMAEEEIVGLAMDNNMKNLCIGALNNTETVHNTDMVYPLFSGHHIKRISLIFQEKNARGMRERCNDLITTILTLMPKSIRKAK